MLNEQLTSFKVMVTHRELLLTFKIKVIQLLNLILGRFHPIFHIICDSHGYVFVGEKYFIVHPIGPATAYKLRYRGGTLRAKEKLFGLVSRLNKHSIIITTYGDLDCRIHIHKQFKLNNEKIPIRELIERTVVNYCIALRQLKKINKKVIALSIPPASYQKNIYNAQYYAPQKIRAQMYREFNELLADECKRTGIKFINTYKYLADERGFTRKEYLRDEIHLNKKYLPFFIQELKNIMKPQSGGQFINFKVGGNSTLKDRFAGLNTMITRKEGFYFIKNKITHVFNRIESLYHPIIHVIGDSHSAVFLGQKFFIAHPIGPVPAASLGLSIKSSPPKQHLYNIIRNANHRSIIVTVFGDHDCRLYLYKQFKENDEKVPLRELIRRIVVDYCKTLNKLKKINKKIIALSIPGASYQKNIYNLKYYAPQKLQAQIYREYNELLEEECRKTGIKFINTYKYLADERGITRKEYLKDELHLNTKFLPFFMQELNALLN